MTEYNPAPTPMYDTRLEEHIIGCMMVHPGDCIDDLIESGFSPKHFYHAGNEKFAQWLIDLWNEDPKKIDIDLILPRVREFGFTIQHATELYRSIPSTANVMLYAEQVKAFAALRAAVKVGKQLVDAHTLRDPEEIREAIAKAETKLGRISGAQVKLDSMRNIKDVLRTAHEKLERVYNDSALLGISGLPTGFADLDLITSGLQRSDLIIIAARPSVGKTALALNLAQNMSMKFGPTGTVTPGATGVFFSLEMSAEQLTNRMVASISRIDQTNLRSGLLVNDDWERYTMAVGQLSEANLVIDDGAGLTVSEIKAKARKVRREQGLDFVIVDYLGKIKGEPGMTRYDLVSDNVRELKNMAKEFDIPVIVLCQLSRAVEHRQDKRPQMSDLRESGEIEQEADLIAFLHRDDYYDKESAKKNVLEIIIAKHRNGPPGTIELAFMKKYGKFVDLYKGGRVIGENGEQQVEAAI